MKTLVAVAWLLCALCNVDESYGHGMMMDPVGRASAWRVGYDTPINYDDNGLNCGGLTTQYYENKGKCGTCGDNYALAQPRPNENTGTYGLGNIVRKYAAESVINVTVRITANHRGHFTFAICPLNQSSQLETEECFEQYPLRIANEANAYELDGDVFGDIVIPVALPKNLTCEHCVLRWHYTAGNNWGICQNGQSGLGCGIQETFRTCSDVAIM